MCPRLSWRLFGHGWSRFLSGCVLGVTGREKQKGKLRIDALDPDLLKGKDVNWWLEVFDLISNGEMPPEDAKVQLTDAEKARIVDWLSGEILVASQVRRSEQGRTSFRRMTRYEYKHALQDLLDLPHDFSRDLPPETVSEDGFKNSSEMLQMTVVQFEQYRELARKALERVTVRGERPKPVYYGITMKAASAQVDATYAAFVEKKKKQIKNGITTPWKSLKKASCQVLGKTRQCAFQESDYGPRRQDALGVRRRQVRLDPEPYPAKGSAGFAGCGGDPGEFEVYCRRGRWPTGRGHHARAHSGGASDTRG